jgi:hypothetical protein
VFQKYTKKATGIVVWPKKSPKNDVQTDLLSEIKGVKVVPTGRQLHCKQWILRI